MRVLVCGSRGWCIPRSVRSRLRTFGPDVIVMHGDCPDSADAAAGVAAATLGLEVEVYPPDPSVPSPQRYHKRNDEMLAKADWVLAFWDRKSRGTKSVIDKARRRGLRVWIVTVDPLQAGVSGSAMARGSEGGVGDSDLDAAAHGHDERGPRESYEQRVWQLALEDPRRFADCVAALLERLADKVDGSDAA